MQLSRTPAPTLSAAPPPQPDPWRWRPWPPRTLQRCGGGAALRAFPQLEEGARGFGDPHCGRGRQGRRTQPRLRAPEFPSQRLPPRAPLHLSAPGPARARNLPRRAEAGARAGCGGYIGVARAPPARGAGALGGFLYLAAKLSVPLAPLALLPPPRPLLLSCLSALFSGLITFHIKAEPSPGCEYNAPPSPLGEERGAGAQRGGRGRGRARRAALRRRGGRRGGGPQPSLGRLPRRRWHPGSAGRPCLGRRAPGSRCPQREKSRGPKASSKERGEPEHGLQLYPHFFFPKPHLATSAGPLLAPEHLPFWSCGIRAALWVSIPFTMRKPRLREVKKCALGSTVSQWQASRANEGFEQGSDTFRSD
ncbi:translation initiation factor IF-2-like [Pteropus medius]|uniref:translation initiation factor IF-2-like n=1 Tax=Pteropus vampyrus TaxID=132908 RepID=UPI00196B5FB5|nr:translation initiation factor IF-2-like [Pteropus giganteus]